MIDERFSSKSFEECGLNTKEARVLSDVLADEIQQELHQAITPVLTAIVQKLNEMGHNLKLYYEPVPGDIHYRDFLDPLGNEYKLLLAVDTILSIGYSDPVGEEWKSEFYS